MPGAVSKKTNPAKEAQSRVEVVAATLEEYANRGVFRGFSRGPVKHGRAAFRMVWHRDRVFDFVFDANRGTMRFPLVLPHVPAKMYLELKRFIASRQSEEVPDHRRIDPGKARVGSYVRSGNVSLTLTVRNGDYSYGARKLINLVHEIFLVFLADEYFEYMIEAFELDPDRI
ncbi:MAG TPA: hypothetical protein VLG74_07895 [Blastocatellia bacterium]|nr:hypothetical protein [Blastocatellia bacterium]